VVLFGDASHVGEDPGAECRDRAPNRLAPAPPHVQYVVDPVAFRAGHSPSHPPYGRLDMRCALLSCSAVHRIMQLCDGGPAMLCWDESGRMQVTARRATQQQQMTAALSARLAMITTLLRRRDEVVRLVALL
jgi:hypothetical protein